MNLPNAERATVSEAKTAGYLLSLTHPKGRPKAVFFRAFGFDAAQWQALADALRLLAATYAVNDTVPSVHGVRYVVEGRLQAPDGRQPWVRTIWIIDDGDPEEIPRFVTAYPAAEPPAAKSESGATL